MTLREMRESKGLSQSSVAAAMKSSQGAVSQWERGDSYPHTEKIPRIAELYGVTEGEIIKAISESRNERIN